MIVHAVINPESFINARMADLAGSDKAFHCFALEYRWRQYYLPSRPEVVLVALVALERHPAGCRIRVALSAATAEVRADLVDLDATPESLAAFADEHDIPWLNLSAPLMLDPICIPKPWGQEIWYTGIEVRGQSHVVAQGHKVPLPWLLSLMPDFLTAGFAEQIVLLKILDPLADERYGDLYFEMHEQKQEVYVVTHVDPAAWPDGTGGIRLGFDQHKRAAFGDDAAFKAAYLAAVRDYEAVRREIDQQLDCQRLAHNIGLNDPVDAATLNEWAKKVPAPLLKREADKRAVMYSFTATKPLRIGDVVKVPCFTPHALQHGVRTVEFQTPVYERKILSFTQKVLTQPHWDTEAALEKISLDAPANPVLEPVHTTADILVERVVTFDDFEVQRIRLAAGRRYQLPAYSAYRLLMVISGSLVCYGTDSSPGARAEWHRSYLPAQAVLLPASLPHSEWCAGEEGSIFLLALPLSSRQQDTGI